MKNRTYETHQQSSSEDEKNRFSTGLSRIARLDQPAIMVQVLYQIRLIW